MIFDLSVCEQFQTAVKTLFGVNNCFIFQHAWFMVLVYVALESVHVLLNHINKLPFIIIIRPLEEEGQAKCVSRVQPRTQPLYTFDAGPLRGQKDITHFRGPFFWGKYRSPYYSISNLRNRQVDHLRSHGGLQILNMLFYFETIYGASELNLCQVSHVLTPPPCKNQGSDG